MQKGQIFIIFLVGMVIASFVGTIFYLGRQTPVPSTTTILTLQPTSSPTSSLNTNKLSETSNAFVTKIENYLFKQPVFINFYNKVISVSKQK